ncbi:MAG: O-antigen ligase family protein [Paenibacillus sp.]|nr:O-antigen ligase family protein [Paenibacillus sp.]
MASNPKMKADLNTTVIYISAIAVFVAGLISILQRGFFFVEDIYPFLSGWFILWTLLVLGKLIASIPKESAMSLLGTVEWRGLLAGLIIWGGPFLMVVLYAFSWLRGPVSMLGTLNELLRWSLYGTFAVVAYIGVRNKGSARIIIGAWHAVGMALCLSALVSVSGGLPLPYFIAYSADPGVSVTGARLAGLLQYPNTFGAVMAVFLLERLFAVSEHYAGSEGAERSAAERSGAERSGTAGDPGTERSGAWKAGAERRGVWKVGAERSGAWNAGAERTPAALLRMLPLFPYAAALLLSESRGAWLAAACACAAALPLKRRLLAPLLAAGAAPVAAAALLYGQLAAARLAVEPLPGLLALAGLWAGALLAGLWLCRRQRSLAGGSAAAVLALAALGWTAGAAAVLLQVQARIIEPSSTVSARAILYRDAWRLAAEAPWLGRGGETWRSVYLAAQSHPYVGSQIHSGYLDILLNLGIVGLVVVLLMLTAMCWLLAVSSLRLLPPFLVIVLHSAVDFDWSYGLVWLLLFWLAALAVADARRVEPAQGFQPSLTQRRVGRLTNHMFSKLVLIFAVSCSSLVFGMMSWRLHEGTVLFQKAALLSNSANRVDLLEQSLSINPLSPRVTEALTEELPQEQSKSLLLSSLIYSPVNPALNWRMVEVSLKEEQAGATLHWIRRSLQLDVYNFSKRTKAIYAMLLLSQRRLAAGDKEGALLSATSGLELLRQYKLLAGEGGSMEYNDRNFHLTEQAVGMGQRLESLILRIKTG